MNKENAGKLWKIIQEAGDYLVGQLPAKLEKDTFDCFSRPVVFGQCLYGYHSFGSMQVVVLQRKLFNVQENGGSKAS